MLRETNIRIPTGADPQTNRRRFPLAPAERAGLSSIMLLSKEGVAGNEPLSHPRCHSLPSIVRLCFILIAMTSTHIVTATDADLSSKINNLFHDYDRPEFPGASVTVIQNGKIIFTHGYGLANLEENTPCRTNTNFRLASVTKQFTAMSVLILAERKQLSLEERLTDFFPEFPAYGRQITVRQLLTHTSGLADYEDLIPKGTEIPVLDRDVLRILMKQQKTDFPPGSKYRYSNSAYSLLALIVEARSGSTFAQFLKQNIFVPLEMNHTLAYEQGLSIVPNRAIGYSSKSNTFERTDQSLTSSVLGDGGIYSSVTDLAKWDQSLYTTKLVSRKMLELAFTPGPVTEHPATGYGFGWFIGQYRGLKEIWHSGNSLGFTTRIARFPEKKFTVIILTNRNEAKLADLPHQIADWVLFESK
jgi:CubicO group peptidase (beta-lactamase class C family)